MIRRRRRRDREATALQFPYVWTRDKLPDYRNGQRCRIVGNAGVSGVVKVVFEDGAGFVVERRYLERRK